MLIGCGGRRHPNKPQNWRRDDVYYTPNGNLIWYWCILSQSSISLGIKYETNCNFPCLTLSSDALIFIKNWGIQSNRQLSSVKSSNSYENKKVFVVFSIFAASALIENSLSVTQWYSCMKPYAQRTEGYLSLSTARHVTAGICTSCQTNEYECQWSLDLFSVIQL